MHLYTQNRHLFIRQIQVYTRLPQSIKNRSTYETNLNLVFFSSDGVHWATPILPSFKPFHLRLLVENVQPTNSVSVLSLHSSSKTTTWTVFIYTALPSKVCFSSTIYWLYTHIATAIGRVLMLTFFIGLLSMVFLQTIVIKKSVS